MVKLFIYLGLGLVFVLVVYLFASKIYRMNNTFDWLATECAPKAYPTYLVKGDLIYAAGDSLYVPDHRDVYNGWGVSGSTHVVGDQFKPLPVQLELTWFSYTEDKFYTGKFELPANKLLELFRAGTAAPDDENGTNPGKRWRFDRIIVGMAPGGDISVWAGAVRVVKEVATYRAHPADLPWELVLKNPSITRAEWIVDTLNRCLPPEVLKQVKSLPVPVGRWALFAKRFPWAPVLHAGLAGRDLWIKGLNGEVEWLDLTGTRKDVDLPPATRGAPREFTLYWSTAEGDNLKAIITLDEDESMAAFDKLSGIQSPEPLTLLLDPAGTGDTVDVFLQRGKSLYRFERTVVKVYSVR